MTQSLSIINKPRPWANIIAVLLYALTAALCALLWASYLSHRDRVLETRSLNTQFDKITAALAEEKAKDQEVPSSALINETSDRIAAYNALIEHGMYSVSLLLNDLESSLSNNVRITSLFYDRDDRYATVSIISKSSEALAKAVDTIKDQLEGQTVVIERQISLEGTDGRRTQIDLRITP